MEHRIWDTNAQRVMAFSVPTRTTKDQIVQILEAFKPANATAAYLLADAGMLHLDNGELINLGTGALRGEKMYAARWDKENV